jgi:hypothetical protein
MKSSISQSAAWLMCPDKTMVSLSCHTVNVTVIRAAGLATDLDASGLDLHAVRFAAAGL